MPETNIIAIVDDDKIFHALTRRIIEKSNVADEVLEFYDGQEALSYILENKDIAARLPDLIFLDIQMPFMDGWQFLDQFINIQLPKTITLYIVSSSVSSLDHEKLHHYKVIREFLIKPFSRDAILDVLNEFKATRS